VPATQEHPSVAKYVIDTERSKVWVDARSSLHPIHSTATGIEGWLELEVGGDGCVDVSTQSQAHLELAVERMSSGNDFYDREMQRRVDSRRYPRIKGDLDRLEHLDGGNRYRVRGNLTFHGVTRTYEHEMLIQAVDDRTLHAEGENVFDVREFGVKPPKILTLQVHPEVSVRVSIVAHKDSRKQKR
jgi:polyisoprenoid-binding protein YceI